MAIIPEDLDPKEKEALEKAMVQSILEASLNEYEDNIIEIDPSAAAVVTTCLVATISLL